MNNWISVPEMLRSVRLSVLKVAGVLILLAIWGKDLGSAFGFAIGTALSLWRFGRLSNSVAKSLRMSKEAAQVYAASSYAIRYLTTAVLLALVFFTDGINFYAALAGLFLVKLVIIGYTIRQIMREGGLAYLRQLAGRRRQKEGDK